jgi:dephospho-CoA kinase
MKIIALTGGIGSGKTTVSAVLRELGAVVIDSDQLAHEVRDTIALKEVVEAFGKDILTPPGSIDRKKLAKLIFSNPQALQKLNQIVHPKVNEETIARLKRLEEKGTEVVVVEIPLIGAVEWPKMADQTWVVKASKEVTLKRLQGRGMNETEAMARMSAQTPAENHVKRGLVIINNDGNINDLKDKVEKLWKEISGKLK